MKAYVEKSVLNGKVRIPSSKSHTIRGIICATLADGVSILRNALFSKDTRACINACRMFGAIISENERKRLLEIRGTNGNLSVPDNVIDVMNSGTTLYFTMGIAGLVDGWTFFTGDDQIRRRPADEMMRVLKQLGAKCFSAKNNGKAPLAVRGVAKGGKKIEVKAKSSQYLSSVLIASPLCENDTEIVATVLNEKPYVEMTLQWLNKAGIKYQRIADNHFYILSKQKYKNLEVFIPSDFSSAAFFISAASLFGDRVEILGLNLNDIQGDKKIIDYVLQMGAEIKFLKNKVVISAGDLHGIDIDISDTPDLLPILSVLGCYAKGKTVIYNGKHVREKETDRIAVMSKELRKMGADIQEKDDGMIINGGKKLRGCYLDGWGDHRVVMSLVVAAMGAKGKSIISTAEAVSVTFPTFFKLMELIGAKIVLKDG